MLLADWPITKISIQIGDFFGGFTGVFPYIDAVTARNALHVKVYALIFNPDATKKVSVRGQAVIEDPPGSRLRASRSTRSPRSRTTLICLANSGPPALLADAFQYLRSRYSAAFS